MQKEKILEAKKKGANQSKKDSSEAVTATLSDSTPLFIGMAMLSLQSASTFLLTPSLSLPSTKIVLLL